MRMNEMLVFDIGMNDGRDSAYYLRRGCRVVGVEADPRLAAQSKHRFSREIKEGRFSVVNAGVAEREGEAEFWVCDDWTPWSSFDRENASRNGSRHHAERVELTTMEAILARFGLPYYCKVDIEGHDQHCLHGFSAESHPQIMSVEFSDFPFIERLRSLGYDRFKLIHQLSFSPVSPRWFALRSHLPNERLRAGLERARGAVRGGLNDGAWYFKIGSSGPWPEDTPGSWMTFDQISEARDYVGRQYKSGRFGPLDCFDLHASTASVVA